MIGKAYEGVDEFSKASFRYQRGPELSDKQKKRKAEQAVALDTEASSSKRLITLWIPSNTHHDHKLNFIEHFWCSCKWYVRVHCEYSIQSLHMIHPAALKSISSEAIDRCIRVFDVYATGYKHGSTALKEHVIIRLLIQLGAVHFFAPV
jgi:hypothetical protein